MKQTREYPIFTITKKGTRWVEGGHPWIYAEEILSKSAEPENGALADAVSESGKYLGTGLYSRESKIGLRLVSRNANDRFDASFWRRRVQYAWDYRKTVLDAEDLSCCRVIFGEADGFPGLTVDRFSDLLVTQTLSVGMERVKDTLFPLLVEVLRADGQKINGIFERNDVAIRSLEGLEQNKGWYPLPGEAPPASPITEICENGIFYAVDVENGQKTGFFLDQKYNRRAVARLAKGRRVLDCFTHTGSFALNAARGGAEHVTAVDVSESAVAMAEANAKRNGLDDRMDFVCADAISALLKPCRGAATSPPPRAATSCLPRSLKECCAPPPLTPGWSFARSKGVSRPRTTPFSGTSRRRIISSFTSSRWCDYPLTSLSEGGGIQRLPQAG